LTRYAEDGTAILKQAGVKILEMDPSKLESWIEKLFE